MREEEKSELEKNIEIWAKALKPEEKAARMILVTMRDVIKYNKLSKIPNRIVRYFNKTIDELEHPEKITIDHYRAFMDNVIELVPRNTSPILTEDYLK